MGVFSSIRWVLFFFVTLQNLFAVEEHAVSTTVEVKLLYTLPTLHVATVVNGTILLQLLV